MWSQICDARIISVRSENAMQNDYRSGRPTHGSGDPRPPKNNLNNVIEIVSSVFQGLSGGRRGPKF
jgi:hypothetical protein